MEEYEGMVPLYQFIGVEAERDRLAAENAELKARYLHVAELNHNQVSMARADCAALAAAIATLDRLREVAADAKIGTQERLTLYVDILYPETINDDR